MNKFPADRELVVDRLLDAPRSAIFRCWTDAELIKRWFAPAPWTVSAAAFDPRPGGRHDVTMRGEDGAEMTARGVFLELLPDERIVFTDAFAEEWEPSDGAPFMVVIVSLSDEDGKTRYVVRARHWTKAATDQHSSMGFHQGWNQCATQLEKVAQTL